MARGNRSPTRFRLRDFQPADGSVAQSVAIGGFGGMDVMTPLPAIQRDRFRLLRNVALRYNTYQTREGTSVIGAIAASELVYAVDVLLPNGSFYIVRFMTTGVNVFANGAWAATTGAAFTANRASPFAITGWNDRILFTAGIGKIFELVFSPSFAITELADAPTNVIHLSTFNGRVVASIVDTVGSRVAWSIKDDHTDWTGLGSGFEDLLSAPGGRPDQQTAVVPITDEIAFCIRSSSIWQIGNTGDFDSPFSFTQLYAHVGSKLPQTVAATERGVICVGDAAQVWDISPDGGAVDVAAPVSDEFKISFGAQRGMSATFDVKFHEYRVVIPTENSLTAQKVMRYSRSNKAWTQDIYPFPIKSIAYTQFTKKTSIDELIGPIDSLIGQINDLGVSVRNPGCLYTMTNDSRWVVRDDGSRSSEALRDVSFGGAPIASGFRVESGDVYVSDPLRRQEFIELICWYEADAAVVLSFDYSYDGGVTWNLASQLTAPATGGRAQPVSVNRVADRPHMQFAVSAEQTPNLRIVSLQAMMREGARIVDAS